MLITSTQLQRPLVTLGILAMAILVTSSDLRAQHGVSSASMGFARAGLFMPSESIRIEEFVSYHRHNLPLPTGDDRVAMDLRWDRLAADRGVLQIGLATPEHIDLKKELRPLNLVLVIDCSGSMSGGRLESVNRGILLMVDRLRPTDLVTIVTYSTEAHLTLPACDITNVRAIKRVVNSLYPGGTTNLHGGLMLGYEQAMLHYDPEKTNRVILLTDGIANRGVIDPQQIAAESRAYNQEGIDLSTIGVGHDLNHDLLRQLADAGRGLFHFIDDSQDIEKVFVNELESLLAPAANQIRLSLSIEGAAGDVEVIGYQPTRRGDRWRIDLDHLNYGATQVILVEVPIGDQPVAATVQLRYDDAVSGEQRRVRDRAEWDRRASQRTSRRGTQVLSDPEVRKNVTIARVAQAIRDAAGHWEQNDERRARRALRRGVNFAREFYRPGQDADVERVVGIADGYLERM